MPNTRLSTVIYYSCIVSLGGFLFGFDAAVISGVTEFLVPKFNLSQWQEGLIVSIPSAAAIVTGLIVGPTSDVIGRKRVLLGVAVLYLLSAITSALAPSFGMLVAARALGGFAFGSLLLAPLYIAEIAPFRLRGRFVSINQMNIVLGFAAAYFANYYLLQLSKSDASFVQSLKVDQEVWRWMLGLEAFPAAIYCLLLLTIPESPRWLAIRGRNDEARQVLNRFLPVEDVPQAFDEIEQSAKEFQNRHKSRLGELLRPELRMVLLIGIIVGVAQQITGINVVYFYATSIFEQCGIGQDAAFAQATFVGVINIAFTILAMWLVDRMGRKPLLLLGLGGAGLSMLISAYGFGSASYQLAPEAIEQMYVENAELGLDRAAMEPVIGVKYSNDVAFKRALQEQLGASVFKQHEGELLQAAVDMNPYIVLIGILGFVAFFAMSLGPVTWVLLSEIYPNAIRGLAMAAVGLANSSISWCVQFFFPWERENFGNAMTFVLYGVCSFVSLALVALLLKETKGRSLEQIERDATGLG